MRKWRSDVWLEAEQERRQAQRAQSYAARVTGRRVVVMADVDFAREGTIVGMLDGMFQVQLDGDADVSLMSRDELEVAR